MARKNKVCRLCSQQGKLCNSHIIPEFFYKLMQLYDSNHRFNIISTDPDQRSFFAQRGIREYLLCKECECKFSKWEDYARGVLYGGEPIGITTDDPKGFECTVNYAKFKLFQLSIFWRVGVSTCEAFSSVDLGVHEGDLRSMLLDEEPGKAEAYGCIITQPSKHTNITSDMIHCMGMDDVDGVTCVGLLLGGFFWLFFLSAIATEPFPKELFLQETMHLRILKTDKVIEQYIERLAPDFYYAHSDYFNRLGRA